MLSLVERLHRLMLDVVKDEFERMRIVEINPVQALLLFNIGPHEVTAGELKTRGYYQGSNVSYNLKKLVDLGYMHHERSAVDRRSVRVRLTDKGRDIHDALSGLFDRHAGQLQRREIVTPLGMEDAAHLLRRLERFWTEQIRYIY
nr:MarR family transcriptional regulator [Falsirhodobacter algicola]